MRSRSIKVSVDELVHRRKSAYSACIRIEERPICSLLFVVIEGVVLGAAIGLWVVSCHLVGVMEAGNYLLRPQEPRHKYLTASKRSQSTFARKLERPSMFLDHDVDSLTNRANDF